MKKTAIFASALTFVFIGTFTNTHANAAAKPITICKKVGQTTSLNGYKFTCVKSGNKIVWNSGVKIATPKSPATSTTPSPTPSPSASTNPTPSPSPTATAQPTVALPEEGTTCTEFGKKFETSYGYIRCDWQGGYSIGWKKHIIPKLNTSKSNNYTSTPADGGICNQSGDTYDITGGYLECRYISGGSLKWIKINNVKQLFTNSVSPSGLDVCKLQNSAVPPKTGRSEGQTAGFPTIARDTFINPGVNEAIVIGVDFPELRGKDADLAAINAYDKKMLNEWYSYYSNGKVSFNLASYDHWIHSPISAKSYSISGTYDGNSAESNSTIGKTAQRFVDFITKEVDLTKYKTVYMIYPDGEFTLDTDMIVRNHPFQLKEGVKNMNFFGWGRDMEYMVSLHWPFYIHESLHDAVLIGHAPGNGWPFSVMTNQSGIAYSPFSWEQFQLGWLPDNQIYCTSKDTLTKTTISLTPMEREDKQTKSTIIKISSTKAIVVESHGIDKWSNFKTNDRAYPAGFYGVMAYLVDLEQAGAPPVASDGRAIQDDTGNSPTYPRWAYWQPVQGKGSSKTVWNYRNTPLDYNDFVALLNDSFVIEGVKITVVGTGDFETIEISKA